MIAAVRIKGGIGLKKSQEDTLRMLKLFRKNTCVLVNDTPTSKGMLMKVKDFITWGEATPEIQDQLQKKSDKGFYRLNSPKKGYGRKGVKYPFSVGGAVGDRKEKINDLLLRML